MAINDNTTKVEPKKEEAVKNEPLLNISLPAPTDGNPRSFLTIGQHNAAAQNNFKKVADLLLAVINNQKSLSGIVVEQQKEIKKLKENNEALAKNIRELLK
jgi:hypothetical protein